MSQRIYGSMLRWAPSLVSMTMAVLLYAPAPESGNKQVSPDLLSLVLALDKNCNGLLLDMARHLQNNRSIPGDILQSDHTAFRQAIFEGQRKNANDASSFFKLVEVQYKNLDAALSQILNAEEVQEKKLHQYMDNVSEQTRLIETLRPTTHLYTLETMHRIERALDFKTNILNQANAIMQGFSQNDPRSLEKAQRAERLIQQAIKTLHHESLSKEKILGLTTIENLQGANSRLVDAAAEAAQAKEAALLHWSQAQREISVMITEKIQIIPSGNGTLSFGPMFLDAHRLWLAAVGGAILSLLTTLLAFWHRRSLQRALSRVSEAAITGDLSQTIEVSSMGEMSVTAHCINRLIGVLQRSQQLVFQLASLVESTGDALIGVKSDGTILSWNKGAQGIYGYRQEEMKGQPLSMLFPPYWEQKVTDVLGQLKGKNCMPYKTVQVNKVGETMPMFMIFSSILDSKGQIMGASILARPLTEGSLLHLSTQDFLRSIITDKI